jgi:aspartyl-tRNA(Asn)/glutamyl-tRNA(Gln) amidotransferase subunit C
MALSPEQVRQVAALAALELQPEEVAQLATELGAILEYVEQLNELDTSGVEPTTHVAVAELPFRPDRSEACLTQAEATAGAPRSAGGAFAVPTFVDEA